LSLHFARHRGARGVIDTGQAQNPDAQAHPSSRSRAHRDRPQRGIQSFVESRAAATAIGRRPELPAAQHAARAIAKMSPRGVANFGRRVSGPIPGCIDELAQIAIPALVVVGEEDEAYLRAADVMAARLPKATKVVIPRAGHVVSIEEPEALNTAILEFLRA
jgi:pimeloyl-ACP methyl ester carboxylesterase